MAKTPETSSDEHDFSAIFHRNNKYPRQGWASCKEESHYKLKLKLYFFTAAQIA